MQAGSLKKTGKGITSVHDEIKNQVEEEYLDSFWNVVRGFAADNYACDTTARIIGYKYPKTFRRSGIVAVLVCADERPRSICCARQTVDFR